jgi:hypothetical protein
LVVIALCALAPGHAEEEQSASPGSGAKPSEQEIGSMHVYLTPAQARLELFPEAISFQREVRLIPGSFKEDLERRLGRRFDEDSLEVYIGYDRNRTLLGYSVVTDEIGKYRPITFMVAMGVDFRVRGAAVLVYRESRGGEVRRSRFLRQYRGKSARDPIRINRDIINITGATMSVRSLNFGMKKVLAVTEFLYGQGLRADADTTSSPTAN